MNPRAGELLALGFEGVALPEDIADLAAEAGLGGIVLFARNCPTLDAVLTLTAAARGLGPDVLVLVDHEGGRVHRLPPPFTRFPPAATVGRTGDPALAARVARAMARELRAAGFDSGLTPVLDCRTDPGSVVVGDRAFGESVETVAACGMAFIHAALAEGLMPVAKHFPGHGRTPLDSHVALPEVSASPDVLEGTELVPFRRGPRGRLPRGDGGPRALPGTRRRVARLALRRRRHGSPPPGARLRRPGPERRSRDGRGQGRVGCRRRGRAVSHSGWRSGSRLPRARNADRGRRGCRGGARERRADAGGRSGGPRPPGGSPAVGREGPAPARPRV